ncbi:MAG: hypothetical protein ABL999_11500 [Pyrinomonadaceae bacterium]
MQSFTSVPFKAKTFHGLSDVNGLAKFSGAGIVLEFETKLFGLISNGVKEARIPIGEVMDIKFKKGVFKRGAKIEIRTKSLAAMANLPNEDGKLILKLKPEDFDRARDAVNRLIRDITTHEAALPPAHTPVSVLFDASEDETQELKN